MQVKWGGNGDPTCAVSPQIYIDRFDELDDTLLAKLTQELKSWTPGIEVLHAVSS